ncbi:hypothetical protein IEQ34_017158 [Dendrobium chrysotoxum]|uniref:Uncharacterized protein n=1 Tax=Dendrobium chrysotoxum TaxID=161865 RepID=A0AAV7FTB3_DENCH|nr:hypothetical protein IEQ34_017158 [Dendrobium chrysotoxum]
MTLLLGPPSSGKNSKPSGCGETPNALQSEPKILELIEKNGKTHISDSLEFVGVSTKLSIMYDELLLEESMDNDSHAGNVITTSETITDGFQDQVLHMLQYAKVSSFDVHSLIIKYSFGFFLSIGNALIHAYRLLEDACNA